MEILNSIASFGVIISAILMTIGLIRPGFVVWWSQSNSRKQVFMIWGSLLVVFAILFFISSQGNDTFKESNTGNKEINTHTQNE